MEHQALRQTGRTTRLMTEAKEKCAWFVFPNYAMAKNVSRLVPDFDPRKILVVNGKISETVRSSRCPIILDHTVPSLCNPTYIPDLNRALNQLKA